MIPILYESNEQSFTSNGIGRLVDCVRCEVTEERNGIYEVEFDYPVPGRLYDEIVEGRIISVTHDDTKTRQPFIIYRQSAPIDGLVTFNAHHVSYNLSHCILQPFTASSVSDAFSQMASRSITPCNFTFWTDKATGGNFAVDVPISIKEILGGIEGSILDVFGGGEYEWDKYTVKLYQNRGTNSGVTIRYGKNLTDLTQERDTSGMYNSVVPYWTNGETTVTLGTSVVSMSGISTVVAVPLDMSGDFDEAPTTTQLRNAAQSRLNGSNAWSPDENITINFVALWQTDEYADVAVLQRVKLCDTVTIIHPELNLSAQAKVVKVVYNVLLDKYDSMELGDSKTSFADTIAKSIESSITKNVPSVGMMQAAIDHATQLITGGLGGYVVYTLNADGEPQEILIMDTDDVQTAVNVIRINKNGIGFSTTGYNGPFTSAWTIDGHFNADFITAGKMSANFIQGGTLKLGGSSNGNGILEIYDANGNRIGRLDNTGANIKGNLQIDYNTCKLYVDDFSIYDLDYYGSPQKTYKGIGIEFSTSQILYLDKLDNGRHDPREYIYIDDTGSQTFQGRPYIKYFVWESNPTDYGLKMQIRPYEFMLESSANIGDYRVWLGGNNDISVYVKDATLYVGDKAIISVGYNGRCVVNQNATIEIWDNEGKINGQTIQTTSSSSKRYKHDITSDLDELLDPHRLYKLQTKQFVFNDDHKTQYPDMAGRNIPGFIAEEVAEIYPAAVIHDRETGEVESWDERRILPAMLSLIQEQKKEIDELKDRLEKLEKLVNKALEVAE